MFVRSEQ